MLAMEYSDGEVRLTAMNPDGLSASQTFKVRRNKKPGEGAGVLSDGNTATIGTSAEDDANVLSVAITKSVTDRTPLLHFTIFWTTMNCCSRHLRTTIALQPRSLMLMASW